MERKRIGVGVGEVTFANKQMVLKISNMQVHVYSHWESVGGG